MENEQAGRTKIERETVEFRLRERERFLRNLIANLPGVVFRCRADAQFTKEFVSDGCFDLTGYHATEIVGENAAVKWHDIIHPKDRDAVLGELRRLVADELPVGAEQFQISYRLVARDGRVKYVRDRFRFVRDSLGKICALEGFATDVTEQLEAEKSLRETDKRYKLLAENMRDLVCLHDLDAKYLYVSPSSETMLGYTPAELGGTSPYDLIHPEDAERVRDEAFARLLEGENGIVIEYRMHDKRGDYYWFETMAQTVAATSGEILQLQTVSRDISKRKEEEQKREQAQNELAQMFISEQAAHHEADAARVEAEHANRAKDEFLQMVSHEFRTPLTTIKTLVRVLQHGNKSETERMKHLETIASECDRQVDMILNLLDVSRLEEGDVDLKREPVEVSRVFASCDKIERPAAKARYQTFTVERGGESLPKVTGDEKALRRALCTIIENAIKYTPEGGMITVAARHIGHRITAGDNAKDEKIAAELFGDFPNQMNFPVDESAETNEEIAFIVCDTGRGILPEDIPKIFQKFYRGKKPHADSSTDGTPDDAAGKAETPGVGLGLYLAKRLITALGGRLTVNSEVGRGSCFTIFLPVWNEDSAAHDDVDEYDFDEKAEAQ